VNSDPTKKRFSRRRLFFLLGVFACELLAFHSLKSYGWDGTGDRLNMILAVCLALLPLVAALVVLLFRGRHFSLRSMLIATTLLAIFIAIIVYPIAQVRQRRRVASIFESQRFPYGTGTRLERSYQQFGIPYHQEPAAETDDTDDIQFWMKPLLGDALPTYPDRAIRSLDLYSDEDIEFVADLIGQLPNLEVVHLRDRVTERGLKMIAERFPKLEALTIDRVILPQVVDVSLPAVRYLTIRGDFSRPNPPHTRISDEQLRDLISVEGLEILSFDGIVIDDSNAPILLEKGNLKMLILWRSKLTERGHDALRGQAPKTKLRVGPHELSPEELYYWTQLHMNDDATIRVTYNQQRETWGRNWSEQRGKMEFFGDGAARIRKEFPIVIEMSAIRNDDPLLITKVVSRLERFADRHDLVRTEQNQSEDAVTIKLVGKETPEQ
jgi:hypothetical protein